MALERLDKPNFGFLQCEITIIIKIFLKNNFSTHKALTALFRHGFFGLGARGGERGLSGLISRNWQNAKITKIGIKTNDNTLSIAQPYFADATIFSPKNYCFSEIGIF